MDKLVFILSISFGSLLLAYLLRLFALAARLADAARLERFSIRLKLVTVVAFYPLPILNSFWKVPLDYPGFAVYPWLGLLYFAAGGAAAIAAARLFRIPPGRAASVFTCSMFANIGAFASLAAFVLYGTEGFLIVQLMAFFEVFMYYVIGFPLSRAVARGDLRQFKLSWGLIKENSISLLPIAAILVGLGLNAAGAPRPEWLELISGFLVLSFGGVLGLSIGLTLQPGRIAVYGRELGLIAAVKFAVIPAVVIAAGAAARAGGLIDPIGFKVVVFFAFLPSAFTSLIPPSLYGFDLDLANSGWLVTTLAMLVVFPILFLVAA